MQARHDGQEPDFVKTDGDIQSKSIIQETVASNKEYLDNAPKDRYSYYYQYRHDSSATIIQINFIICRNCFWCASLLESGIFIERCPGCSNNTLEAIPINSNERFIISNDQRRGVTFEFSLRPR